MTSWPRTWVIQMIQKTNEAGVRMSHTDANPININKIQLNLSVAWLLKMVEPTLFLCLQGKFIRWKTASCYMEFSQVNTGVCQVLETLLEGQPKGETMERRCWPSFMTHSGCFLNSVFLESPYKLETMYLTVTEFIK